MVPEPDLRRAGRQSVLAVHEDDPDAIRLRLRDQWRKEEQQTGDD